MVSHRHRSRVTARKYDAGIRYEFSLLTRASVHLIVRYGAPIPADCVALVRPGAFSRAAATATSVPARPTEQNRVTSPGAGRAPARGEAGGERAHPLPVLRAGQEERMRIGVNLSQRVGGRCSRPGRPGRTGHSWAPASSGRAVVTCAPAGTDLASITGCRLVVASTTMPRRPRPRAGRPRRSPAARAPTWPAARRPPGGPGPGRTRGPRAACGRRKDRPQLEVAPGARCRSGRACPRPDRPAGDRHGPDGAGPGAAEEGSR